MIQKSSLYCHYYLRRSFKKNSRLECNGMLSAHWNLYLLGSSNFSALTSGVAGITGMHHHTWLILSLVETEFHYVGQTGVELLTLWSAHLGLPKCWDYRLEPPCLASACYFKKKHLEYKPWLSQYTNKYLTIIKPICYVFRLLGKKDHDWLIIWTHQYIFGPQLFCINKYSTKLKCLNGKRKITSVCFYFKIFFF